MLPRHPPPGDAPRRHAATRAAATPERSLEAVVGSWMLGGSDGPAV